jgi:hypothetical protein
MTADDRKSILRTVDGLSSQALRVLAVGVREFAQIPNETDAEHLEVRSWHRISLASHYSGE